MAKLLLIILICIIDLIDAQSCKPFGLRLSFGSYFTDASSDQKQVIMFNTQSSCSKSYVVVSQNDSVIKKYYCQQKTFSISDQNGTYQPFIQTCSLKDLQFQSQYYYMAFGQASKSSEAAIPFDNTFINFTIINPDQKNQKVNLIYLADWGFLKQKKNVYDSLQVGLKTIKSQQNINGLVIVGDIAYDLDSNNGQNYIQFITMLSQISIYVPVIYVTGNHQHSRPNTIKLFSQSFSVHKIVQCLAVGLRFGPIYLALFDPYNQVFNTSTNLKKKSDSLHDLQQVLEKQAKRQTGRFIIASSHYPMRCSVTVDDCQLIFRKLFDHFKLFYKYNVNLYIGAHKHTYERTYPYYDNGTFLPKNTPYNIKDKQLTQSVLSIIQGVGGNDNYIYQNYTQVKDYTVSHTVNETGFGVLSASNSKVSYTHYSCKGAFHVADQMMINLDRMSLQAKQKQINLLSQ